MVNRRHGSITLTATPQRAGPATPPSSRSRTIPVPPRAPQATAASSALSAAPARRARRPPGAIATSAHSVPTTRPVTSSRRFSPSTTVNRSSRPVADGAQERQFAAPLEHVAKHDRREPDRSDQQTQPAERLKRRQIGVLDGVERREPFGRERGIGAQVTGRIFDRRARRAPASGRWRRSARKRYPCCSGKSSMNALVRHEQLSLEDAVRQRRPRSSDARVDRRRGRTISSPNALVQNVGQRVRVRDDRHRLVVRLAEQQQPWIRALGVGRGQRARRSETAPASAKRAADAEDSRAGRLVEIQAARIVAGPHAKRLDPSTLGTSVSPSASRPSRWLGSCAIGRSRSTSSA